MVELSARYLPHYKQIVTTERQQRFIFWRTARRSEVVRSTVHLPHPGILQKRMQEGDNKENLCSESQLLGEKPPEARRDKSQFCRDCRGSRTGGSKTMIVFLLGSL
ncbi:hypothetical protein CapIbe_010927 [Capra ibex]